MTIRKNKYSVPNLIVPSNILLSVFDKSGLDVLVNGILKFNPHATFYSTGGTGKKILEILDEENYDNYQSVESYTNAPEMEGGLVKTLHPKIHAGLLGERGNPAHEEYLRMMMGDITGSQGHYFDVMVGNLYPFKETIAKPDVTPEDARVNIDIGGPTMIMAAAKNWHSVAVLTNPEQYDCFIKEIEKNDGIKAEQRFDLAKEAMTLVGNYRGQIAEYFLGLEFHEDIKPGLLSTFLE